MTKYLTLAALWWSLVGCGCQLPGFPGTSNKPRKPVLPDGLSAQQVMDHVNANASRIRSWSSYSVSIKPTGAGLIPISLSGKLVVESPKQFRLSAGSAITGKEFDVGANTSEFWLWIRRSPQKFVMTAAHEDLPAVQEMMTLPMDPAILMESLGVKQAKMPNATIEEPDGENIYRVSSVVQQPGGERLKRTIEVSKQSGEVITQALAGPKGVIAVARFSKHKYDKKNDATMPHRIEFYLPATKSGVTLSMRDIEINPANIDPELWEVPQFDGYPIKDLGKLARSRRRFQPSPTSPVPPAGKPLPELDRFAEKPKEPGTATPDRKFDAPAPFPG